MKTLCGEAGVDASKAFLHNLRHLFASAFIGSLPARNTPANWNA